MRKRILEYRRMMDELLTKLEEGSKDVDITALKTEHMNQISFFQHERLIHLIVYGIPVCSDHAQYRDDPAHVCGTYTADTLYQTLLPA